MFIDDVGLEFRQGTAGVVCVSFTMPEISAGKSWMAGVTLKDLRLESSQDDFMYMSGSLTGMTWITGALWIIYLYLSIYHLSIHPFTYLSILPMINLSICLSISIYPYLSLSPSSTICLSICLSLHPSLQMLRISPQGPPVRAAQGFCSKCPTKLGRHYMVFYALASKSQSITSILFYCLKQS